MTIVDEEYATDVLVLGGGCAGLVAALAASVGGARVTLLEKTDTLGGTLAWSGGAIWGTLTFHPVFDGQNGIKKPV